MAVPGLFVQEGNPMNENLRKWLPWVMIAIFVVVGFGPRWMDSLVCNRFGRPLFDHALPAETVLVSKDAATDGEGVITAALLLQTDLSSEELEAFYADLNCPPAKEGQSVELSAKALAEEDLDVLKTAKIYVEGAQYQFVYVTSK